MNKLISVIIPVYNVEKYIKECLDSIINQTYQNLQIIIVDDGSTDNSGKICDEYSKKDKRITVVHQQNQGAGAAKNTGLDLIKGEFFSIIDSDDYIDENMYSLAISYMNNEIDIVQCLFCNTYKNYRYVPNYCFKGNSVVDKNQFLFELLYDWKYAIFANKVFKTSLLGNTRFPVGRKIDDEFFTYKLVSQAKKIKNIENVFYFYRMRKSSVMNENTSLRRILDRCDCFIERYEYISNYVPGVKHYYYNDLAKFLNEYSKKTGDKKLLKLSNTYPQKSNNFFNILLYKWKLRKYFDEATSDNIDKLLFE